jgi:putative toxin-antitoxin system antitoxin component (TIGR02293 family)
MSRQPRTDKQGSKVIPLSLRVSRIRTEAKRVWGNAADAAEWLNHPHCELGGATPISLVRTETGVRTVEALLAALGSGFPV